MLYPKNKQTIKTDVCFSYFTVNVRPASMSREYQQSTVAAVLMINEDPMSGIASKYDYEKNEWKKK